MASVRSLGFKDKLSGTSLIIILCKNLEDVFFQNFPTKDAER